VSAFLAAPGEELWGLGWKCFPEMMSHFERLKEVIDTAEEPMVLDEIYEAMLRRIISSPLLHFATERLPGRIADTLDKADPRDFASCTVALAVTAYTIADLPTRFGRRLNADEVKKMATESKVDEQWRAAGIWP